MMKKPSLLILPAALALCGCGQKGPLYLPEHNDVVITAPVSPSTEATPQPLPGEAAPAPAPGQAPGNQPGSQPGSQPPSESPGGQPEGSSGTQPNPQTPDSQQNGPNEPRAAAPGATQSAPAGSSSSSSPPR